MFQKFHYSNFFIVIAAMIFISCSNASSGIIYPNIIIEYKLKIKTPTNGRAVYNASDVEYYIAKVESDDFCKEQKTKPGNVITIKVPSIGKYNITLSGINSKNVQISKGSVSKEISQTCYVVDVDVPMTYFEYADNTNNGNDDSEESSEPDTDSETEPSTDSEIDADEDDESSENDNNSDENTESNTDSNESNDTNSDNENGNEEIQLAEFTPYLIPDQCFGSYIKPDDWELYSNLNAFISEYNSVIAETITSNNSEYNSLLDIRYDMYNGYTTVTEYLSYDMWHTHAITVIHSTDDIWYKFISVSDESKFPSNASIIDETANIIFADSEGRVYSTDASAKIYCMHYIPENTDIDAYISTHNDVLKFGNYYVQANNYRNLKRGINVDTNYDYIISCTDGWYMLDFQCINSIEQ